MIGYKMEVNSEGFKYILEVFRICKTDRSAIALACFNIGGRDDYTAESESCGLLKGIRWFFIQAF